ncbi:MAG: septal ring lytic transglycosylase RlpA family protein [Thermoleophilaceae bacterium]
MPTEYTHVRARTARRLAALAPLALGLLVAAPPDAGAQTPSTRGADPVGESSDASSGPSGAGERRDADGSSGEGRRDTATRLEASRHVRQGELVTLSGRLAGARAGETALVEVSAGRRGWTTVARATTRAGGRFKASWRPPGPGRFRVRARPLGEALAAGRRLVDSEDVNVYRASVASWYGPGFYGRRTACGQIIRPSTLGVAHKRLPCGTRVTFRYGNRTVTVPVIDRGPFVGGREWDLTAATRRTLAFPSTGVILSTR